MLILPRRFDQQPQEPVEVDFDGELAQAMGLQIVWVGSTPSVVYYKDQGTTFLSTIGGTDTVTGAGRARYMSGTTGDFFDLGAFSAPNALTCGIVGIASGLNAIALGNKNTPAAAGFDIVHGSSGVAGASLFRIGSISVSPATHSSTRPVHFTGLWDRNSGGGVISAVVDGAITNGSSTTSISGSTQNLYVGRRATTYHEAGSLCLIYIGNKRAPEPVWRELHRNPWQIFRPTARKIFMVGVVGGPSTYTITPSGGLSLAGSTSPQHGKIFGVSGGLSFGGSAALSTLASYTISPTGGIQFSGSANQIHGRVFSVSGGITFAGSVDQVHGRVFAVDGGISFSGSAALTNQAQYTITPSGGLGFGGNTDILKQKVIVPSGGLTFGGSSSLITPDSGDSSFSGIFIRRYIGRR